MLRAGLSVVAFPGAMLQSACALDRDGSRFDSFSAAAQNIKGNSMKIQYLEIVTPDVNAVCETYAQLHDVEFGESDQDLGGARTATLENGGMLGVRAPLRDDENPIVRPYMLVEDIQATVDAAAKSGAEVALPPMELAGHGTCAVVIQGGIESGFWQL